MNRICSMSACLMSGIESIETQLYYFQFFVLIIGSSNLGVIV